MSRKKSVLTIFLVAAMIGLFSHVARGQEKTIGVTRSFKQVGKQIDSSNAYNILTGKRFSSKELFDLISNSPDVYVEERYDKYGKLESYWFNPNKKMGRPITKGRTPTGEKFPEFVFTSINGDVFDSEDLIGKWVVVRFEGYPEDFMFKKHEILDLDKKINALKQTGEQVEAFAIFYWEKEKAQQIFALNDSNFNVVSDGGNFGRKFKIHRLPKTLVINPEGTLMGYYNYSEDIDLNTLSKK